MWFKMFFLNSSLVVLSALSSDAPLRWEPLYEPGGGGAIVSLNVSPHDPRHLVASGDMLGAAVSRDGGDTWQPAFGFPSYEMCDATFHPVETNVIWMGTCMGPFKSVDGGGTWREKRGGMPTPQPGAYTVIIEKILIDPLIPKRLLAFGGTARHWSTAKTFGWIWESLDDGETWRHLGTLTKEVFTSEKKKGVNIWSAQVEPGNPSRLHLLSDEAGWWSSDDSGVTWKRHLHEGLAGEVTGVTFHPKQPSIVWATTHNRVVGQKREPGGIFKSNDGGKSFTAIEKGIQKTQGGKENKDLTSWFNGVALSQANPDVLYVNDQAWNAAVIYKSTDGGATWLPVLSRKPLGAEGKHAGVQTATWAAIALHLRVDPASAEHVYGFNSEFILRTVDGGKNWDDATAYRPDPARTNQWRGRGWNGWCSMNVAWNPFKPGQCVVQAMDGARAWVSDDNLKSWHYALGQTHPWLGGQDVGFSRDGYLYVTTGQFGDGNGIQRSTDWGKTWTTLAGEERGLPKAGWGNGMEYAGVFVHPENGKQAWVALKGKLITTRDGGETWAPVKGVREVNYLAGDPTRPGRFYVKTRQGVFVTEDGERFENLGLPHLSGRSRITCDTRGRVLVCQWREGRCGVWRYTPETKHWKRLLDEEQAFACCADPNDPTRLLLATSMDPFFDRASGNGVWISSDDGTSWSPANEQLPMLRANACAFNPSDSEVLIVGTYGMGFFRARWPRSYQPKGTRSYRHVNEDDAASRKVDPPKPKPLSLKNGDFSSGAGETPEGWAERWGDVAVLRDTSVFRSQPAALRVSSAAGKSGQVFQAIQGHPGEQLRLKGWLKTAGQAKVNVAVQAFDEGWKQNAFLQAAYRQGASDWTFFDRVVQLPEWTARFNVLVLVEGEGQAWLDDAALEVETNKDSP